jgi:hypothetical protein
VKAEPDPSAWMEAYLAARWHMRRLPPSLVLYGLGALAEEVGRELRGEAPPVGWRSWRVVEVGERRAMRVIG